jgi:hypothetical protein
VRPLGCQIRVTDFESLRLAGTLAFPGPSGPSTKEVSALAIVYGTG